MSHLEDADRALADARSFQTRANENYSDSEVRIADAVASLIALHREQTVELPSDVRAAVAFLLRAAPPLLQPDLLRVFAELVRLRTEVTP